MYQIYETVSVSYLPDEMYDLIHDIQAYPEFVPNCHKVEILYQDAKRMLAKMSIGYGRLVANITTESNLYPKEEIHLNLLKNGPLKTLHGYWRMRSNKDKTKIEFYLEYTFSNKILENLFSPVFKNITCKMINAFCKRANKIYGNKHDPN